MRLELVLAGSVLGLVVITLVNLVAMRCRRAAARRRRERLAAERAERDAVFLRNKWLAAWPEVGEYQEHIRQLAEPPTEIPPIAGREVGKHDRRGTQETARRLSDKSKRLVMKKEIK